MTGDRGSIREAKRTAAHLGGWIVCLVVVLTFLAPGLTLSIGGVVLVIAMGFALYGSFRPPPPKD